ncbi:MAG: hypothetical protein FJZ58_03845 [Chlamydiae bacterium]|nr:hypothetical protein [Chlamydiota bacterium]
MSQNILGNLGALGPINETNAVGGGMQPSSNFSSLMQKAPSPPSSSLQSPLELAHGGIKPNPAMANPQGLLAQMQLMQGAMQTVQGQISYPNLKMSSSQKYLIKNKLLSTNATLQAIQERMGSEDQDQQQKESQTPEEEGQHSSPVSQFLRYITDGMSQLESAKVQLADLKDKADSLTPMDFLFIQLKLAKAQQEIEFTSILLSKMVDGFKMIMNIQL